MKWTENAQGTSYLRIGRILVAKVFEMPGGGGWRMSNRLPDISDYGAVIGIYGSKREAKAAAEHSTAAWLAHVERNMQK